MRNQSLEQSFKQKIVYRDGALFGVATSLQLMKTTTLIDHKKIEKLLTKDWIIENTIYICCNN